MFLIAHDYVSSPRQRPRDAAFGDILCLLVIHGHATSLGATGTISPAAKGRMWAAQKRALRSANIDPAIVDEYGNIEND